MKVKTTCIASPNQVEVHGRRGFWYYRGRFDRHSLHWVPRGDVADDWWWSHPVLDEDAEGAGSWDDAEHRAVQIVKSLGWRRRRQIRRAGRRAAR